MDWFARRHLQCRVFIIHWEMNIQAINLAIWHSDFAIFKIQLPLHLHAIAIDCEFTLSFNAALMN